MSREYNLGGKSIIVDRIEEIFEEGTVSTKAVNNIRQIVGEQRQSKNIQKLTEEINKATSDGVISKAEKPGLKREWASLVSSYSAISDKFTADTALEGITMFKTLVGIMDELTPIMESIFNDMDSDYTDKDNISKLTNLFVASWEHITLCSQLLEQKLSISDRFYIQLSADRTIVNTLDIGVTLLYYINGSYADVTSNPVYEDSDFVWKKTSDESFERTGKVLSLTLDDMSSETENFSMTFTHIYKYNDAAETEIEIKKSISFSISTGTLSQWTWSDAATKADLLMDPLAVWLDYRREFNTKKYLWRRDTDDLLKPDNEKEWLYFRESGLDGIDGYSRAQLTLYKRSASGEPSKSDLGTITYTFATNAYSGTLGGWSTSIPSGEGDLYAIYASALFNGATDTVEPNEWTTPAKLSTDGAKGEDGMSIYTVLLFKRSASIPSKPSGTVTYNFHTNTLTGADGWYREPPASDGNPIYSITATAASNTGTDVISPSEWSTPMVFVKDGKDGATGPQGPQGETGATGPQGASGKDAKSLRISADKTVFALNSLGVPYPNQVATVNVVKQNITESHKISGWISAPDNATEFKVTPQMMGYEPIKLTNLISTEPNIKSKTVQFTSFTDIYQINLDLSYTYKKLLSVLDVSIEAATNTANVYTFIQATLYNANKNPKAYYIQSSNIRVKSGTGKSSAYSGNAFFDEINSYIKNGYEVKDLYLFVRAAATDGSIPSSVTVTINGLSLYESAELEEKSIKFDSMTDSQKLEWIKTYIPTIGANSSWTIGGKAKNLLDNPTSSDGWTCGTSVTNFSASNGIVTGTSPETLSNSMRNWIYKPASASLSLNDKIYGKVFSISATRGYRVGFAYYAGAPNANSYLLTVDSERIANMKNYQYLTADNDNGGDSTAITIDATKGVNVFNATEAGWIAQLSLMGIEGDTNVKAWLDTYIPFFEGEMDFPRLSSATIKAEAGGYEDYLTIQAISQNRSIQLIASPAEIELDSYGEANTDSVTIKAQKNNIFGNLKWSNNRGLPVVAGDEQSFVASQMGLKPITLKQMLSDTFENSGNWSRSGGSITVSKGVLTQTTSVDGNDFVVSKGLFAVSKDRTYYACINIDSISSYNGIMRLYLRYNGAITDQNYTGVTASLAGKRFGRILKPTVSTDSATIAFGVYKASTSTTVAYSKPALYDVTELLAHPKFSSMTDSQKLEWLNTYIPTIKAGESWTIGGKADQLLTQTEYNGTDSSGIVSSINVTTTAQGLTWTADGKDSNIKLAIRKTKTIGNYLYIGINVSSYSSGGMGVWDNYAFAFNPINLGLSSLVMDCRRDNYITLDDSGDATMTIDKVWGFDLTSSGWLAQLSLMGIEGADNVKAWIDANVPFFVGEFDFPAYRDITWTAEYEEVSASVTVGAKKTDFKIESSHESYALSPRGVCKNRQTMTFHVDALGLTEQPSWRIYYDGEVVEQDIKGNTISWTLEINESPRTITAEVTSGKYYDILTLNAMVNGNPMPERVTGGYSSRMIPQDVIRSIKALDDGVSPLIEGDYALVAIINNEGKTEPTPYRYSGVQWIALNGNESNASEIFFALQNDAWATDDTMATASIIIAWIKNLISQNAFIENLKIKNEFSSTNYEEDANGMPVSGWKGDTESGTLKSYQMVSHGMEAYNAKVQGSLEHDALKTVDAKSGELSGTWADSTKTHWSFKSLMEGVPRYTGAAGTYHNSFRSGSITYNGETYDQYYSKMWKSTPESQHTYTYTKHLGKASGGHILGGGESGESVSSIASRMGITLQSNDAVRLNFHCSGATTRFDCYINGQLSYSEKVDGVGVFNGWLRPSDIVRIYCYNSNIFNERDLTCTVTLYQVGYPMQPLTTAPSNLGPGVPADIGEDGEATTKYAEKSWTVPTGKLINQAWVSFNADVYGGFDTLAELYVNGNVIASFNKNTDWYKINWKATVKGGDTITLRVYSIRYPSDPSTYYYCNAYGVMCAFGYVNDVKGLYLQQSSGNKTLILPFYAESEPAGWTDKSISTSLATVTKQYLIGDKFISTLVTAWGSANMNKELICTSSKIIVDGDETAIDRVKLTDEELSYRTTAGFWKSIVKLSKMGLYESLSLTVATLDQILSIETASVVPKTDSAYQIGTPTKHYASSYIKEHRIDGWRMSVSNSELTFIYEG